MQTKPKGRPVVRIAKGLALAVVSAIAVSCASLWIDHGRETRLPLPTGPFAVGRVTYHWTDENHADEMAAVAGTKRELLAWIWYPATPPKPQAATAPYLPEAWRTALDRQMGWPMTNLLTRDLSRVRTNSFSDAELSPRQRTYPVAMLRAGLAALITDYTALAEDLASHGYVVVGFDAPYRSFVVSMPDGRAIARAPRNNADLLSGKEQWLLLGRLVEVWAGDMGFALDQLGKLNRADPAGRFQGRLDLQRVGVFGHSLGGATALEVCRVDARCKAGINIDGAPHGDVIARGVKQPFLFLLSDHSRDPEDEVRAVMADFQAIFDRMPANGRQKLTIRGANHFGFADFAIVKSHVVLSAMRVLGAMGIDGERQIEITRRCVLSFFDHYLKTPAGPGIQMPSKGFPELQAF